MSSLKMVLDHIDGEFESDHLSQIRRFMQLPSVSATGEGILATAEYLMREMRELGAKDVHLIPVPEGEFGHPQVYGELIEDQNRPTILVYSMYDVQPVDGEDWVIDGQHVEPFGAEIRNYEWMRGYRGRCLIGRGAINTKAPTEAFFNVLRTIRAHSASMPVNFIFVIEGEEELGSIHIERLIRQYADKLSAADLVYFPFFSERYDGAVPLWLGVKGLIPARVWVEGGEWGGPAVREIHSMSSGVVENPIFKIVELIGSLKDDTTGDILVPGVMDDRDLVGPDEDDKALLQQLADSTDWKGLKESLGVRTFRKHDGRELTGVDYYVHELFNPGLSVNGISSGYVGEGMKTIIPREVTANLDIRLAPFQKTGKVRSLYEQHIRSRFPMARLSFRSGYPPAKVPANHPYVRAMVSAIESCGKQVVPTPLISGSAPFALFQAILGLPFVLGGLGHGGRQHSANEYAVLESEDPRVGGVKDYERSVARFVYNIADLGKQRRAATRAS